MAQGLTVALVDGPLARGHPRLAERVDLVPDAAADSPAGRHARAVADTIAAHAPAVTFVNLVIFANRLATGATVVAQALEAAAARDAPIVHCSWGLARADTGLFTATRTLVTAGRHVVAAAAARGGPVYPAAFTGVVSVQGDARCGADEWSRLDLPTALFGACPAPDGRAVTGDAGVAGASVAAAHLSGHLARLSAGGDPSPLAALRERAAFVGRERRTC